MKKLTLQEFIEKARLVHGDKYDYSKVVYRRAKLPVTIICPIHGEFELTPQLHYLGKSGCPKCSGVYHYTNEEFIEQANKIHNNKYDYSKTNYVNNKIPITIICPIHGEFEQRGDVHLRGCGCPKCANKNITTEEFILKAREIHGYKYDYSKVEYVRALDKVCIICPEHGEFWLKPNAHLNGNGCPKCNQSHGEKQVEKYLIDNNIEYISQYRINIDQSINSSGFAYIDFYLPKYNIFIEYNGEQHYVPVKCFGGEILFERQQKRDQYIRDYCRENDIKLIEISYDDDILNCLKVIK